MSVESRFAALEAYVAAETPFDRLTGRVFVDAQAAIQWIRLGVFEKVLHLLPSLDGNPRFQIQDAAFNEVANVLSSRFHGGTRGEVKGHLQGLSNLAVDDPIPSSSPLGEDVRDLQERVFLEAGENPDDWPPSRHLGEAETLAVMRTFAPGSVVATADKDAIQVSRSAGIGSAVRPFAFTAGNMRTMDDVSAFWGFTCFGRECVSSGQWHDPCVEALECEDFHDAVINRSPIHPSILRAAEALRWMREDAEVLVGVLESRGE